MNRKKIFISFVLFISLIPFSTNQPMAAPLTWLSRLDCQTLQRISEITCRTGVAALTMLTFYLSNPPKTATRPENFRTPEKIITPPTSAKTSNNSHNFNYIVQHTTNGQHYYDLYSIHALPANEITNKIVQQYNLNKTVAIFSEPRYCGTINESQYVELIQQPNKLNHVFDEVAKTQAVPSKDNPQYYAVPLPEKTSASITDYFNPISIYGTKTKNWTELDLKKVPSTTVTNVPTLKINNSSVKSASNDASAAVPVALNSYDMQRLGTMINSPSTNDLLKPGKIYHGPTHIQPSKTVVEIFKLTNEVQALETSYITEQEKQAVFKHAIPATGFNFTDWESNKWLDKHIETITHIINPLETANQTLNNLRNAELKLSHDLKECEIHQITHAGSEKVESVCKTFGLDLKNENNALFVKKLIENEQDLIKYKRELSILQKAKTEIDLKKGIDAFREKISRCYDQDTREKIYENLKTDEKTKQTNHTNAVNAMRHAEKNKIAALNKANSFNFFKRIWARISQTANSKQDWLNIAASWEAREKECRQTVDQCQASLNETQNKIRVYEEVWHSTQKEPAQPKIEPKPVEPEPTQPDSDEPQAPKDPNNKKNLTGVAGGAVAEAARHKDEVKDTSEIIKNIKQDIIEWLGEGYKIIKNKAEDLILISKDGLRKIRFDFNRPNPHKNPHTHIEELVNGKWQNFRIFPKDVPPY